MPGIYEYKFIIDGNWQHDPTKKTKVSKLEVIILFYFFNIIKNNSNNKGA